MAVVVVFGALALPTFLSYIDCGDRGVAYASVPTRAGPFSYHYQQMTAETLPIDLLIVGSSVLWTAIDTPLLQESLSRQWQRPATVRTLGYSWEGPDVQYVLVKDMLQRRKVGTLLIQAPKRWARRNAPHPYLNRLVRPGEESLYAIDELPNALICRWWCARTFASGVHLLNALRRPSSEWIDHDPQRDFNSDLPQQLGAAPRSVGFAGGEFIEAFYPPTKASLEEWLHSGVQQRHPLPPYKTHFLQQLGQLCRDHGVHVIVLDIPDWANERTLDQPQFLVDWQQLLGGRVTTLGLPGARLFQGLDENDRKQLYFDYHFNRNGCRWFTRSLAPALAKVVKNAPLD